MTIVVIGPGRSGTTISAQLFGVHPDLAWFSGLNVRFPSKPVVSVASRLARLAPQAPIRGWPRPSEAISLWDRRFPGFYEGKRDLHAHDADDAAAAEFRRDIAEVIRWHGGRDFFTKLTGWPRVGFLQRVLPGVRLINVDRDPRAVVMSMRRQRWGDLGRHPERFPGVDPIDYYADLYLRFYDARRDHDWSDVVQLQLEALTAERDVELRRICEAVGLPFTARYARRIRRIEVVPDGDWRRGLPTSDVERLADRLARPASELGYS